MIETTTDREKMKNDGTYNTFHGPLSQEWIDGRY